MRYEIKGLTRDTGEPRTILVEAESEDEAVRKAGGNGIVVESVRVDPAWTAEQKRAEHDRFIAEAKERTRKFEAENEKRDRERFDRQARGLSDGELLAVVCFSFLAVGYHVAGVLESAAMLVAGAVWACGIVLVFIRSELRQQKK